LDIYQIAIRPFLFSGLKADPERLHGLLMRSLRSLNPQQQPRLLARLQQSFCFSHPALRQTLWGLSFDNPVGLAAGFDKDGLVAQTWSAFGFGFAEMGTVTLHGQPGNPRPRLFRLPEDRAALNRMGFNNQGAAAMAERLAMAPASSMPPIPIGVNLGKSKVTPLEQAAEDYRSSFMRLKHYGDYFVVNVSSPNTPGLRSLQDAAQLDQILAALQQENTEQKPLLVKIAPDLEWGAIADILALAQTHRLAGIIATNTTIRRDNLKTHLLPGYGTYVAEEPGGISGAPVRERSTEVIRFIYEKTHGTLPIIGVGGIFTAADAWEKITAGASLIQVYTGWIYEGPWMVRRILEGLVERLEQRGMNSIAEAIGQRERN
jgi:dihydroorotate dehydrogenase